jgi:hypothetical protein
MSQKSEDYMQARIELLMKELGEALSFTRAITMETTIDLGLREWAHRIKDKLEAL